MGGFELATQRSWKTEAAVLPVPALSRHILLIPTATERWMIFTEMTLSQWTERRRQSTRILKERQAEVSIMEADLRECEKNIRRLSGYDKIATATETE